MEEQILLAESGYINNIKYTYPPSAHYRRLLRKSVSQLVTIDWKNILPVPPQNDSDITRNELKNVSEATSNRTKLDIDLIKLVDKDPIDLFLPFLKKHNLSFPHNIFKKANDILEIVAIQLKWQYSRPRPYQLAKIFNIPLDIINTDTHQTPAYPSGHAAYGALVASILSDIYPEHAPEFYRMGLLAGYARVLQGVHYASDNDAGVVLANVLWNNVKQHLLKGI